MYYYWVHEGHEGHPGTADPLSPTGFAGLNLQGRSQNAESEGALSWEGGGACPEHSTGLTAQYGSDCRLRGIEGQAGETVRLAVQTTRVRILVIVSRVHFLQKGILNHLKKRWERLTTSTLSESLPTLF